MIGPREFAHFDLLGQMIFGKLTWELVLRRLRLDIVHACKVTTKIRFCPYQCRTNEAYLGDYHGFFVEWSSKIAVNCLLDVSFPHSLYTAMIMKENKIFLAKSHS